MQLNEAVLYEWIDRLTDGRFIQIFNVYDNSANYRAISFLWLSDDDLLPLANYLGVTDSYLKRSNYFAEFLADITVVINGKRYDTTQVNYTLKMSFEEFAVILETNQRNNSFGFIPKKLRK
jgi:hypothetical protein